MPPKYPLRRLTPMNPPFRTIHGANLFLIEPLPELSTYPCQIRSWSILPFGLLSGLQTDRQTETHTHKGTPQSYIVDGLCQVPCVSTIGDCIFDSWVPIINDWSDCVRYVTPQSVIEHSRIAMLKRCSGSTGLWRNSRMINGCCPLSSRYETSANCLTRYVSIATILCLERLLNSFTGSSPMLTGLERQSPEIPHNFKHILGVRYENGKF